MSEFIDGQLVAGALIELPVPRTKAIAAMAVAYFRDRSVEVSPGLVLNNRGFDVSMKGNSLFATPPSVSYAGFELRSSVVEIVTPWDLSNGIDFRADKYRLVVPKDFQPRIVSELDGFAFVWDRGKRPSLYWRRLGVDVGALHISRTEGRFDFVMVPNFVEPVLKWSD